MRTLISVPPGCAILFNEKTVHEIAKRKIQKPKSYRQYFKWRISEEPVSTMGIKCILNVVNSQASFPLHAVGKTPNPPMYGKMHIIHWSKKIASFSENVHDGFLDKPNKKGQIFVKRFMPSLQESGIPLFPEYTDDECNILFPRLL
jgi:hypothetical protein